MPNDINIDPSLQYRTFRSMIRYCKHTYFHLFEKLVPKKLYKYGFNAELRYANNAPIFGIVMQISS